MSMLWKRAAWKRLLPSIKTATLPRCPSCHEILLVGSKLCINELRTYPPGFAPRMLFCSSRVKLRRSMDLLLRCCNYFIRNRVQIDSAYRRVGDLQLPRKSDLQAVGRVL